MKTNLWKMASVLMLGLAMTFVSCEKEKEGPEGTDPVEKTPEFPEKVIKTLEDGADFELTVNPNMDWEVALSGDTDWFKLKYNGEPVPSASGKAGEVKFTVTSNADEADFDEHRSSLSMKMGGEEKVIAEFVRNGRERVFGAYSVNIVDGDFEYGDEGYVFSENESTDFAMSYVNSQFQTYIKVVANFGWRLKETPEWAESVELEGRYVVASEANVPGVICLRGNNPKYPLGGAEGNLVFVVDDGSAEPVEKEIKLSLPAVEEVFEVSVPATLQFDEKGWYCNANGDYQEMFLSQGAVAGIDGVKIYAFDSSDYSWVGSADKGDGIYGWVSISLDKDDENILKDWEFRVSVSENNEDSRSADIFVIPGTVKMDDPESQILNDSYNGYREEFLKYKYSTVSQKGNNGGEVSGGMIIYNEDDLASAGAKIEALDPEDVERNGWIEMAEAIFNVGAGNYYQLTLSAPESNVNLSYAKEFWGADLYEFIDGEIVPSEDTDWCVEQSDTRLSFSFKEEDKDRNMLLAVNTEGGRFTVILVKYDPSASGEQVLVSFAYPSMTSGASIRKMSSAADAEDQHYQFALGELGEKDQVYELVYGPSVKMPFLAINTDFNDVYYPLEDEDWLSFEDMMVMMNTDFERKGIMVFRDADMVPVFAIVCKYDPNFGSGSTGGGASVVADNASLSAAGAKFGKMSDDMNFAEMVYALDDIFGLGEENYYLLTIPSAQCWIGGFTFSKEVVNYVCYDGELGEVEPWAEVGEEMGKYAIGISLDEDDWMFPKFLEIDYWDEASESARPLAIIAVNRE